MRNKTRRVHAKARRTFGSRTQRTQSGNLKILRILRAFVPSCEILLVLLFLSCSILFVSCEEPSVPPQSIELPQGYGSFSLRIADNENNRTILPTAPSLDDYAVYTLDFTATSGGANASIDRSNATLATEPIVLAAGTYSLTVSAFLDTGKERLAAQGTLANISITAGANASAVVQLKALTNSGAGIFNWSVNITAGGVTSAAMTISQGAETKETVTLNNTGTSSGNPSLSSGVYNVSFHLVKNGGTKEECIWNELLYIYSSLSSNFTKTFNDEYFYSTHYNVTFNHNYDSISVQQSVLHGDTLASNTPERYGFNFLGWYTDESLSAPYDFDTEILNDFTLYAYWEVAGTVTVSKDGGTPAFYLDLDAALASITGTGDFTVTLLEDHTMTANRTINTGNQHITIVGKEARKITHGITDTAAQMFTISNANASFTLGDNVTIQGRITEAGAGAVVNNTNGTFTMLSGSKITGHQSNSGTSSAVNITSTNSIFVMSGGSIEGNNNTTDAITTTASGGVYFTNGTFTMSGGSITGNTQGAGNPSDVYHALINSNRFTLSGDAAIGALKLNATSSTTTAGATVTIGTGWTGSIAVLNLRGNNDAIATASTYWNNSIRTIFSGIDAEQVENIGLGEFISGNNTRQAIEPDYFIGTGAKNLGRLTANPATAPVIVTESSETTGYATFDAALIAIDTSAGDFTITLRADQTMTANRTISSADQHITIVGEGARTITHSGFTPAYHMFTISGTGADLTLGNNITIQGRSTAGAGAVVHNTNGTFRMLEGSKITGHAASSDSGAAVNINGTNAKFIMSGGIISGNNNTSVVTTASGGVYFAGGTFTMTGGSITGNTQGVNVLSGEPSDGYHSVTTANAFTISGNASIGALKLNALSYAAATVTIGTGGWTGSINRLNLRGNDAAIATASSYWTNSTRTIFSGIDADLVGNIGLWEFISSNDSRQAIGSDYIIGTGVINLGRLAANPATAPVTVTVNDETYGYNNLAAAFTDIGTLAGNFTVALKADQTMTASRTISGVNQYITIVGEGARKITHSGFSAANHMFAISSGASLTLGNNITIQGRTEAGIGAVINISNGTFRMLEGSQITGHTANTDSGAAVNINGSNAVFEMSGGSINGNNNTIAATATTASGGVYFGYGYFTMSGGSITGNKHGIEASDAYIATYDADRFTMSGNAALGALKLNADSVTAGSNVLIGAAGWNGSVETLNLRGNKSDIDMVARDWNSRTLFKGINATGVGRIGLGEFISSNNNARRDITSTHYIGTTGNSLGRLIIFPSIAPVTVTVDSETTGYLDLAAAFNDIGTKAGNFIITLKADQTMTTYRLFTAAGQHVTIVGEGEVRKIIHGVTNAFTNMISISNADTSLTLGNNITIQGRTAAGEGVLINVLNGTFRMLAGSRITGHTMGKREGAAVTVVEYGRFEMSGGSIDGNINTANTTVTLGITNIAGGVYLDSGYFTMTGGSINGNTLGSNIQSDVYHTLMSANRFTLSGNASIGVLRMNANSTLRSSITISESGWTGSITTLDLRGEVDTVAAVRTYWNNATVFNGMTSGHLSRIGLGDFIGNTNTLRQAINTMHYINASGVLTALPDVPFMVNGNPFDNLTAALTSTAAAGTYVIEVFMDQNLAPQSLTGSGRNITITSPTGAEVQLSANGQLFTVNSGVTLTLGAGITLRGRSNNNGPLITNSGGTLIIDGATITGNLSISGDGGGVYQRGGSTTLKSGTISFNNASGGGGGMTVDSGSFTMEGGIITDNSTNSEGGGICGFNTPTVIMSGGLIQRNTARSDSGGVYMNSGSFTKTGNSIITGWGDDQVNGNVVKDAAGTVVTTANHAVQVSGILRPNTVGAGVNLP